MWRSGTRFIVILILAISFLSSSIYAIDASSANSVLYDVDFSESSVGLVKVLYNAGSNKKIKLVIQQDDEKYIYNISDNKNYISFPLQLGDGEYDVKIYENTQGTSYKKIYSESEEVNIIVENKVYLNSVQEVSWNYNYNAIQLGNTLLEEALQKKQKESGNINVTLTDFEIIETIYKYIIMNITYDYNKIDTLNYDYIPNIDEVITEGDGICYDYSALYAAILRSQGIPTKLVKGYTTVTDVYHAWNEVYIEDENRWIIVDTTFDAYKYQKGLAYTLESDPAEYMKSKEF